MKHIHFIGICGVAMGGLAIAFKKAGHEKLPDGSLVPCFEVSGSDAGFFPPVSDYLKKHQIDFYPGWHPEKINTPDLVVVGNVASSTNPEWQYVQKNKLNYKSYPEVIAEYFVKQNSIVCAGTYGKTTTAALLSWILTEAGYNPSYMFGGLATDDFDSASLENNEPRKIQTSSESRGNYSVIEGDEYKSARWDNSPKFSHYSPTHLLLTAIKWDHADVYPTEKSYFEVFEKLIKSIPENGLIVANEHISHITYPTSNIITYGKTENCVCRYFDIKQNKNGLEFKIMFRDTCYVLRVAVLGDYMAENITGVFAMAHQIGIAPEKIISAVESFKGIKRRLEKRYEGKITVFDDIAHSPTKAEFTLNTLRKIYNKKIIAVFEPNTGNRQPQSTPSYDYAFTAADEVIIPKLTKLKTSDELRHFDGEKLTQIISQTHKNAKYIENDEELINYIIKNTTDGDVIVFLGSHGFRGMIDELVKKYENT